MVAVGCVVAVDSGVALALYAGSFVRDTDDLPSNFSFFLVPKLQPHAARNSTTRSMMLQLKVCVRSRGREKECRLHGSTVGTVRPSLS